MAYPAGEKGLMARGKAKFLALIFFIIGAFTILKLSGLEAYLDEERIRGWIDGFGPWGPLVYILIYSFAPVLMAPGLPLTVAGGILFGPLWGSVYVSIGATIGAALAFLLARKMGRDWVEGFIKGGRLSGLDEEVRKKGWKIVAFTRLIPVFPYNILNFAFGLTSIRFSHYLVSTFVFMIPGAVAYVVFSSSILGLFKGEVSKEFIFGAALVITVSLIPFVYKRFRPGEKGLKKDKEA